MTQVVSVRGEVADRSRDMPQGRKSIAQRGGSSFVARAQDRWRDRGAFTFGVKCILNETRAAPSRIHRRCGVRRRSSNRSSSEKAAGSSTSIDPICPNHSEGSESHIHFSEIGNLPMPLKDPQRIEMTPLTTSTHRRTFSAQEVSADLAPRGPRGRRDLIGARSQGEGMLCRGC